MSSVENLAVRSRHAAVLLGSSTETERNEILRLFKSELYKQQALIEAANKVDMEVASVSVLSGALDPSIYKRLELSGDKFESCLRGIDDVIAKSDPIGVCDLATELSEGLKLYRVSCPIGVLAVIFEARPEAGIQIASLSLKSGNAAILKGGHEARHSNHAIFNALKSAMAQSAIPEDSIQLIDSRDEVAELLRLDSLVDLVIPRGSKDLIKSIKASTKIPVLGHADGLCSVFVNDDADITKAVKIVIDCKCDYPAACNAVETLLVHEKIVSTFLPALALELEPFSVEFRADENCLSYLPPRFSKLADEADFNTEFLNFTLAVRSVGSIDEAIEHINTHGSHHTDVIITENGDAVDLFMGRIDSAGVYHNCSSRFADGFRYGFGAEVGISTNRIHSRGPVGLEGLLIYKYKLFGHGDTVAEINRGEKKWMHKKLELPTEVNAEVVNIK